MKKNNVSKEVMERIEKLIDLKKRLHNYLVRTHLNTFMPKLN
tara:strand:- start:52 stop:177 length:126 start_codon:yes stop_codon:yes gene_type:complete